VPLPAIKSKIAKQAKYLKKKESEKMNETISNPQILAEDYQTPLPNAYDISAESFVDEQNRFSGEYGAGMLNTSNNGDVSQLTSRTSSTNHVPDADFHINWEEPTMCFIPQVFFQDAINVPFELTGIPAEDYQTPPSAYDTSCDTFVSPQDFLHVDEQNRCSGKNGTGKQNNSNNGDFSRHQSQSSSSWSQLSPWSQLPSEHNAINHIEDEKFSINYEESSRCSIRGTSVHCLQDAVECEKVPRTNAKSRKQTEEDESEDDFIVLNKNSKDSME